MQSSYPKKVHVLNFNKCQTKKKVQETVFLELIKEITDTCCCIGPPDYETITMVFSTKKKKKKKKNKTKQKVN